MLALGLNLSDTTTLEQTLAVLYIYTKAKDALYCYRVWAASRVWICP